MSLTRVRLGSTDPPLKAWFSVPNHVATVRDLKKSLCADIDALHDVTPDRVTLLLDEFELLDDSPINVLRDGDLLLVQCRQDQTRTKSAKRKAEESDADSPRKKTRRSELSRCRLTGHVSQAGPSQTKLKSPSTTSLRLETDDSSDSDSSDSSDPSDSSDESSHDSSDSSTESSDSSDDSDTSPSEEETTEPTPNGIAKHTSKPPPPPVPPGCGRPQTKARNARRRKKRQHERQPPPGVSGVNVVPVAPHPAVTPTVPTVNGDETDGVEPARTERADPTVLLSLGLSNKNKKRGFKAHLGDDVPKKIIFADSGPSIRAESSTNGYVGGGHNTSAPRLIPLSERQERGEVPRNVLVTSVDVEEGMWGRKKKRNGMGKRREVEEWEELAEWLDYGGPDIEDLALVDGEAREGGERGVDGDGEEGDGHGSGSGNGIVLGESATEVANFLMGPSESGEKVDWEDMERLFDTLPVLTEQIQARKGVLVAWKALDINPTTLTPDVVLKLARIVCLTRGSNSFGITVQQLLRPAFGFGFKFRRGGAGGEGGEEEGSEEEQEWGEEENLEWEGVVREGWRVVR